MSGSSRPPIPRDHLDVPSSAQTGFRYLRGLPWPYAPPLEWEDQHTRAEEQGPHAPDLMPLRLLYRAGLDTHRMINWENGWCLDA